MWYYESTFYQIYPFGFCGAPEENDNVLVNRISKISDWIPHMKQSGIDALYLCPVFQSDRHGYDTRDYTKLDCRLGSNEQFAAVCKDLHDEGIRVVLDGVFNHVGRGFWAFLDVLEKREQSQYRDWFILNFGGNSNYNDGLWYEGWEGHFDLVKLNLYNPAVVDYLFSCIKGWVDEFDIDGLRLDVAYMLPEEFLQQLNDFCKSLKPDFFLIGETIHGDYNRIVKDGLLDSCTNYECYKGIYSSFNDMNMFEIGHSLNRQFGPEHWTIYKGKHLMCFVDNHDVNRLASVLTDSYHIALAYGLLFSMPGIPCLYYGSEWGAEGVKANNSDKDLRPCFSKPVENNISKWIAALSKMRKANPEFSYGNYQQLYINNPQLVFMREYNGGRVMAAINASSEVHEAFMPIQAKTLTDLITGEKLTYSDRLLLKPKSASFYRLDG